MDIFHTPYLTAIKGKDGRRRHHEGRGGPYKCSDEHKGAEDYMNC